MGVARWIQRIENVQLPLHGMFWNKFSHSSVGRRVGRGREVVVQSNGPLLAILWPLPPRVDRCRKVVAIRDDILLRLEQRMSTLCRPNVRKFHYALQSVQKPRLAKHIIHDIVIVKHMHSRATTWNLQNFYFKRRSKYRFNKNIFTYISFNHRIKSFSAKSDELYISQHPQLFIDTENLLNIQRGLFN